MSTRICKVCVITKDYTYLCLNTQGRATYKNQDDGLIWHGKTCGDCFKKYVKETSGKERLCELECKTCGKTFKQKNIKQGYCGKKCYSLRIDK